MKGIYARVHAHKSQFLPFLFGFLPALLFLFSFILPGSAYALNASCSVINHDGQPLDHKAVIVFIPSGFVGDIPSFESHVQTIWERFNDFKPFSGEIEDLSAFYVTDVTATESKALNCALNCNGIDRLLCCDTAKATSISSRCTGLPRQTVIVHNSDIYGGAGYTAADVATTTVHASAPDIVIHELGHSFFNLNDEYNGPTDVMDRQNCDVDHQCPKWSDLIEINFPGVKCLAPQGGSGCKDSLYAVSNATVMQILGAQFFPVNERIACCAYQAATGDYPPSLCGQFTDKGRDLDDFCAEANGYLVALENPQGVTMSKTLSGEWEVQSVVELPSDRLYHKKYVNGDSEGELVLNLKIFAADKELVHRQYLFTEQVPVEYFDPLRPAGYARVDRDLMSVIVDVSETKSPIRIEAQVD